MRISDEMLDSRLRVLKTWLKRGAWTPKELAEKLGVTDRSIFRYLQTLNDRENGAVRRLVGRPARYTMRALSEPKSTPPATPPPRSKSKTW